VIDLLQSDIIATCSYRRRRRRHQRDKQDLMNASEDAPIIRLAIPPRTRHQARRQRHSHRAHGKDVVVRFRLDGVLQVVQNLPKKVQLGLISRLRSSVSSTSPKASAARRSHLRQHGRQAYRLPRSSVPAKWGEKLCMRILDNPTPR